MQEDFNVGGPAKDWRQEIRQSLRNDLNNVISDDAITRAIERYNRSMLEYMVLSGEIKNLASFNKKANPIPKPLGERYQEIIEDIWKHEMRQPTWSVEYFEGSKVIKKDKKAKADINDLILNEHALIFWYANQAGHFLNFKSNREKMQHYIDQHSLGVTWSSFKTIVSKYIRLQDRCESGFLFRIYPFLEYWYFNGLAYLHRDQELYRKSTEEHLDDSNLQL